jgi:hypothetical protein
LFTDKKDKGLHIMTTPFVVDGQEVDRLVGAGKKGDYMSKLNALLN